MNVLVYLGLGMDRVSPTAERAQLTGLTVYGSSMGHVYKGSSWIGLDRKSFGLYTWPESVHGLMVEEVAAAAAAAASEICPSVASLLHPSPSLLRGRRQQRSSGLLHTSP